MLDGDLKTIKELADMLDTTKNRVAYQVRKLPDDGVEIIDGVKYLTKQSQTAVIAAIKKLDGIDLNSIKQDETTSEIDNSTRVVDVLNHQIELLQDQIQMLKDILKKKDERIDTLLEQLNYSQRLIDQQQQLEQYRNRLYLIQNQDTEAKESKGSAGIKKWWQFWL